MRHVRLRNDDSTLEDIHPVRGELGSERDRFGPIALVRPCPPWAHFTLVKARLSLSGQYTLARHVVTLLLLLNNTGLDAVLGYEPAHSITETWKARKNSHSRLCFLPPSLAIIGLRYARYSLKKLSMTCEVRVSFSGQ